MGEVAGRLAGRAGPSTLGGAGDWLCHTVAAAASFSGVAAAIGQVSGWAPGQGEPAGCV